MKKNNKSLGGFESTKDLLAEIDQVLIMTVHPGYYGSSFLQEMVEKIKELRRLSPRLNIEIDGGIKPGMIEQVYAAGANMFVSGSYLVKAENFAQNMNRLKTLAGIKV